MWSRHQYPCLFSRWVHMERAGNNGLFHPMSQRSFHGIEMDRCRSRNPLCGLYPPRETYFSMDRSRHGSFGWRFSGFYMWICCCLECRWVYPRRNLQFHHCGGWRRRCICWRALYGHSRRIEDPHDPLDQYFFCGTVDHSHGHGSGNLCDPVRDQWCFDGDHDL